MKVLVIGCGRAGRRYAENALILGHETGIYDIAAKPLVSLLANDYTVSYHKTADSGLMWADAVVIATPPETHIGMITEAAWVHEKPTLVEKPLSDTMPPNEWLLYDNLALVVPVTTYRFHSVARQIKDEYHGGNIHIRYVDTEDAWRGDTYERSELEQRIHFVDLLWWVAGPEMAKRHRVLVTVEKGDKRLCEVQTSGRGYWLEPEPEVHRRQLEHFIACVEGREQPICPLDEAVRILEVALA